MVSDIATLGMVNGAHEWKCNGLPKRNGKLFSDLQCSRTLLLCFVPCPYTRRKPSVLFWNLFTLAFLSRMVFRYDQPIPRCTNPLGMGRTAVLKNPFEQLQIRAGLQDGENVV